MKNRKKLLLVILTAAIMIFGLAFAAQAKSKTSHKHSYKWVVTKNATCTMDGEKVNKCSCGKIKSRKAIKKTGHKWQTGYKTVKGKRQKDLRVCTRCNLIQSWKKDASGRYDWRT